MKATRAGKWLLLLALLAGASAYAVAGKAGASSRNPRRPQAAVPAQEKPAAEKQEKKEAPDFSQEPFVFEQFHIRARFETDGTGQREMTVRVRVQSEAGVQQLGQLVIGYNSANEKLDVSYVRVRKVDGSVVSASAADVQDLTAPIAREAPVYTDFRQKHVTVPGLRPGETLEYQTIAQVHTPLAPGHFWLEHSFVDRVIMLDEQLEVNVPRDVTLKLKTKPDAEPAIREENGRRIYLWKHANLERPDEDEAAPKKKRRKPEAPDVQLTTFQSWEDIGRWYGALERSRVQPDDAIRAKAAELLRGREGASEKVEALYKYVAQNFRYVSLSFGVGRYQPHSASEVFANQYGDCKDKHTLLAAMLEAAGFHAWPVLINASRKIDPEVPSPSQFDHVISAVPMGDDLLWLDTTTEVAPFRLLAASVRNKQALLVPGDGSTPRLVETPADPPFPALQRVEIEGQINELGKLNARVRYTMRGDGELLLRSAFRRTPKNQWKQLAQIVAYSDGLRGEVTDVSTSDPTATAEPFRLEYQVAQPNFLDWSSKKSKLALPLPALGLPSADADAEAEDEPIELGTPLDITTALKLELPAKYAARAPIAVAVSRDYAEYRSSYKLEGSVLTAERKLAFRIRELPAVRARDYLAFVRAVRNDEGQTVAVETSAVAGTPEIPDAVKADDLAEAGHSAYEAGNYALAETLLKRATEKEPKHRWAWNTLGVTYLAQRRFAECIAAFQKQIEVNPYDEFAYNNLGRAYWQTEHFDEAIAAFEKQIEMNPLDQWAHRNLGDLYRERHEYEKAAASLEKAAGITPDDPSVHVSLGDAYLQLGQEEKALASFEDALKLAPIPPIWNNIAYQLSLKKVHLERAQQYAESAVASAAAELRNVSLDRLSTRDLQSVSGLAAYWDTLGWIHFQKGDLEKAERYVKAAWVLDLHGEVGDHLGQIYEKQGRRQEAIRTYALAIAATKPVPETRRRLTKLAGGEGKIERPLATGVEEFAELNSILLGKLLKDEKEKQAAEFYVVLVPQGAAGGNAAVEGVKFISGSEKLRPLASALRSAKFPNFFPDATPTKIVRRGTLTCLPDTGCIFVLQTADSITSVD